jgi:hypothetical protein
MGFLQIRYRGRATAFRERFFACGETAITPMPALIRSYIKLE